MDYQPLDASCNEIRLLRILPLTKHEDEQTTQPICCDMEHFSLNRLKWKYLVYNRVNSYLGSLVADTTLPPVTSALRKCLSFYSSTIISLWACVKLFKYFAQYVSLQIPLLGEGLTALIFIAIFAHNRNPDMFRYYKTRAEVVADIRAQLVTIVVFLGICCVTLPIFISFTIQASFSGALIIYLGSILFRRKLWPSEIYKGELQEDTESRYHWGDYMALSYTWGDPIPETTIVVNGKLVKVRENLAAALRKVREQPESKCGMWLWVDALCINQDDILERNAQVKRMRFIYERAWTIIVWLGEEAECSDNAVSWIIKIHVILNTASGFVAQQKLSKSIISTLEPETWKSLACLLHRSYWERVWIIQELAMGHSTCPVLCGSRRFSWDALFTLIELLQGGADTYLAATRGTGDPRFQAANRSWNMLLRLNLIRQVTRSMKKTQDIFRVRQLQMLCQIAAASDDRDRTYGILGLVGHDISSRIVPDYQLPLRRVYADFAKALIEATGNLDIIHSGDGLQMRDASPSWAPDFRICTARAGPTPDYPFKLWNSRPAETCFSNDGDLLTCKGFRIDTVDGISALADSVVGNLQSSIVQAKNSDHRYGSQSSLVKAIQRTLLGYLIKGEYEQPGSVFDIPWIRNGPHTEDNLTKLQKSRWTQLLRSEWNTDFEAFRLLNGDFIIFGRAFREYFPQEIKPAREIDWTEFAMKVSAQSLYHRRLATTARGYLGLGVNAMEQGDGIFIIFGCTSPVVLRQYGNCYKVVGDLYIHGALEVEGLKWLETGECCLEDITLC